MTATLGMIRRFIVDHFSDEELTQFCFDHFHQVYQNFVGEMTVGRKALLLVDYCNRRDNVPSLLELLRVERPGPYLRVFGRHSGTSIRKVNINTANSEELQNLPGIGAALAAAIISARPFESIDELARVVGIGPKRLAAVHGWIDF